MGIVTTSSETTFEPVHRRRSTTSSATRRTGRRPIRAAQHRNLPDAAAEVGDTWTRRVRTARRVFTWQLAIATRPTLFVFSSVGRLGHDSQGNGGLEGRMTIEYHFTRPGDGHHALHQDDDDRGVQARAADRRVLPDGQSRAYRRLPRCRRAGTRTLRRARNARRSAAPCRSNSRWLVSHSGTSESNPWQVPGNTCSSVATPARISRSA